MLIDEPPRTPEIDAAFECERANDGYIANHTRLWAWRPDLDSAFAAVRARLAESTRLSERERAILVCATASSLGDSYCSLAWGIRLAAMCDPDAAAAVLRSESTDVFTPRERALVEWARQVVQDPNATTVTMVHRLRSAGLNDQEIFDATAFIAFRLAFSTVNDALGAIPDEALRNAAPVEVRSSVTYGR